MTAIDASFGEVSFQHDIESRSKLLWVLPWGVALAIGAGAAMWLPDDRSGSAPNFLAPRLTSHTALTPVAPRANSYGPLVAFVGQPDAAAERPAPAPQSKPPAPPEPVADASPAAPPAPVPAAAPQAPLDVAAALAPPRSTFGNPYGVLVDPEFLHDDQPAPLNAPPAVVASLESAPASPDIPVLSNPATPAENAATEPPVPPARPAGLAPAAQPERRAPAPQANRPVVNRSVVATAPAPDDRNIFEKLFGINRQAHPAVTAYAEPESGAANGARGSSLAGNSGVSFFGRSTTGGYDQYTAVYDISTHTVYMPDGGRLEAHSGLGDRLDDPRFVSERDRGATPPHLYDLTLREQLFHGVQALRLTPVGEGGVYGRAGLLAHTFMLGPNGDSNGCVSFRDYEAFLRAFQQGRIKRLAVVARL